MPPTDRARAAAEQIALQNQVTQAQPNQQANQSTQQPGSSQNASPQLVTMTQEQLQALVTPMQEAIRQLQEDKQAAAEAQNAKIQAEKQKALDKDLEQLMAEAGAPSNDAEKLNELTNAQMLDILSGALENALAANAEKIKSELSTTVAPSSQKVAMLEKTLVSILSKLSADETRQKYTDFDQYAPAIAKIMGEYPGLDYEKAYYIAKSQAAGSVAPPTQTFSEKPADYGTGSVNPQAVAPTQSMLQTIADRGRNARGDVSAPQQHGVVGFRNFVLSAADEVANSRQQ